MSEKQGHTIGRLKAKSIAGIAVTRHVESGADLAIALSEYDGIPLPFKENARRLVAAWNACAGIHTLALEVGAIEELVRTAGILAGFPSYEHLPNDQDVSMQVGILKNIQAALAKLGVEKEGGEEFTCNTCGQIHTWSEGRFFWEGPHDAPYQVCFSCRRKEKP